MTAVKIIQTKKKILILEHAASHVEGGQYLAPDFLLGQVYDGNEHYLRLLSYFSHNLVQ